MSFCCRDTNEAPDNYFEGHKCITESEGFKMVCLSKPVLDTALSVFNHFRGGSIENIDNKSFRFAGYKQYIFLGIQLSRKRCSKSNPFMCCLENKE